MKLVGAAGQAANHFLYDASGLIVSGTVPQLVLPRRLSCSHLIIANLHATLTMYIDFGSARATATISGGVVTACTVVNPGFGFSLAPSIEFRGGGADQFLNFLGSNDPNSPPPAKPAKAHCVMTGAAPNMSVASITVDYGGAGYLVAPYVRILNHNRDPNGCADPSALSASGFYGALPLPPLGGSYYLNGTVTTTDQLAIYCSTGANAPFSCKWAE